MWGENPWEVLPGSLHAQPLHGVAHVLRGMMATGVPGPKRSATVGGCLSTQCPGAAAWRERHPQFSSEAIAERDKARTISKPELLHELLRRADEDHMLRYTRRP